MATTLAIINTRVSTTEQLENNSLNRQLESVEKAAKKLGAVIPSDGRWSGSVSSKAGKNVSRKDLQEMLDYCKRHRSVKYAIFDEYDRYMRSLQEGMYFEVAFEQLGVKVWFASESDSFNGNDAMAKFMRAMSAFRAEGSNEERQRKSVHGHEQALREGRYTFPSKPGYKKSDKPGIKIPHEVTFTPLQRAFKDVASGIASPKEALQRLNASEFSKVHSKWSMDKFRQFATDPFYVGTLTVNRQVKGYNRRGAHTPMITSDEHASLVKIMTGNYKPRGAKKQYNPEFPMNKLMRCEDCGNSVIFTGAHGHNGRYRKTKNGLTLRKTINHYWKYRCRGCGKSYHRDEVHDGISKKLAQVQYTGAQKSEFIEALETVWQQKQQDKLQDIAALEKELAQLQDTKSKLVVEFATTEPSLKEDLKLEIENIKQKIVDTEIEITNLSELDKDLVQFVDFGMNYSDELANDWWDLDYEDRLWCQKLILPGGITFNSQKKVGTPEISLIYRLAANKKSHDVAQNAHLVEMPGTAPGSEK